MKILMVNNYLYLRGGAEKVMLEEIDLLSGAGHHVACFSARHENNVSSPLESFFPSVPDHATLSLAGRIAHYPRMIANGRVRRAFERALDAFVPDVVHFHNIYGRLTPVVIDAAVRRAIPTVLTTHDYKLICATYLRDDNGRPCDRCGYKQYAPALLSRCHKGDRLGAFLYGVEASINGWLGYYDGLSKIACPSGYMLAALAAKGVRPEKLRLVRNFVPDLPPQDAKPRDRRHLLYAGRLSAEKGVGTLIEAMVGLRVGLLVMGDGPERAALERKTNELRLSSRVQFLGRRDKVTVLDAMRSAFAVVVPSICLENAPMTIIEAFGTGTPVIAADVGGIPEIVTHGETGRLFPAGDATQLRNEILQLLANRAWAGEMGQRGRSLVEERFTGRAHLQALTGLYEEATG